MKILTLDPGALHWGYSVLKYRMKYRKRLQSNSPSFAVWQDALENIR